MIDSYAMLFAHVARTLPDSMSERRHLLEALTLVLPAAHPAQSTLKAMLASLDMQDQFQRQLPLDISQGKGNQ